MRAVYSAGEWKLLLHHFTVLCCVFCCVRPVLLISRARLARSCWCSQLRFALSLAASGVWVWGAAYAGASQHSQWVHTPLALPLGPITRSRSLSLSLFLSLFLSLSPFSFWWLCTLDELFITTEHSLLRSSTWWSHHQLSFTALSHPQQDLPFYRFLSLSLSLLLFHSLFKGSNMTRDHLESHSAELQKQKYSPSKACTPLCVVYNLANRFHSDHHHHHHHYLDQSPVLHIHTHTELDCVTPTIVLVDWTKRKWSSASYADGQ